MSNRDRQKQGPDTELTDFTSRPETPLCLAVSQGNLEAVKGLLKRDPSAVYEENVDGGTPLSLAVKAKNTDIATALVKSGAESQSVIAAFKGNKISARFLQKIFDTVYHWIKVHLSEYQQTLEQLTPTKKAELMKMQNNNAHYNITALPGLLEDLGPAQKFELLKIQDKKGCTALMHAACSTPAALPILFKNITPAQKIELLKTKNNEGWTALMLAAYYSPAELPALLEGISPTQKFELLKMKNNEGWTALMLAARNQPQALPALLEGLDPTQKLELLKIQNEYGSTALMHAVYHKPEALPTLLEGLDSAQKFELLCAQTTSGWTAVIYVAHYNITALPALLKDITPAQKIELLKTKDNNGWTALMHAAHYSPANLPTFFKDLTASQKVELLSTLCTKLQLQQKTARAAFLRMLLEINVEYQHPLSSAMLRAFVRCKAFIKKAVDEGTVDLREEVKTQLARANSKSLFYRVPLFYKVVSHHQNPSSKGLTATEEYLRKAVRLPTEGP